MKKFNRKKEYYYEYASINETSSSITKGYSVVKVKINGKHEVLSVKIDSNANLTSDDLEMLEDMIMIAMNNANKKAENFKAEKLSKFGNIPGLL